MVIGLDRDRDTRFGNIIGTYKCSVVGEVVKQVLIVSFHGRQTHLPAIIQLDLVDLLHSFLC